MEITAIDQANRKEQEDFEEQMLELGRMLEQDFKMQTSKSTAALEATSSSPKKGKKNAMRETSKEKVEAQASMERVQNFEEAFNKIKAATGISDIEELVRTFIKNEDQNFSLFNYVNEQTNEIEKLEEQVLTLRKEEQKYAARAERAPHERSERKEERQNRCQLSTPTTDASANYRRRQRAPTTGTNNGRECQQPPSCARAPTTSFPSARALTTSYSCARAPTTSFSCALLRSLSHLPLHLLLSYAAPSLALASLAPRYTQESGDDVINQHKQILKELETKLQASETQAERFETKCGGASKTIESLKRGIQAMFEKLECKSEILADSAVTEANMLQFLGIIEQRTNEILAVYHQIQSKQRSAMQAIDSSKGAATPNVLGLGPTIPMGQDLIHVNPPKLEEFSDEEGESDDDEDAKPLTRDELKAKATQRMQKASRGAGGGKTKKKK
jgi:hypothetical protein